MGTRHNIQIKKDGKIVLSQYGQWDGYPDGQGKDILNFLSNKENVDKLKLVSNKLRFFDANGKDKEFLDEYNKNSPKWSNEPDNRTIKQRIWFDLYISRDIGANILYNIINSIDEEILVRENTDMSFIEGDYVIDLDKMIFKVTWNDITKVFDINKLPSEKEFLINFKDSEQD